MRITKIEDLDGLSPTMANAKPSRKDRIMLKLEKQVLEAYAAADRDIPDSDLDNEQPVSLTIRTTLGDIRAARTRVAMIERGAEASKADQKARDDYDAKL